MTVRTCWNCGAGVGESQTRCACGVAHGSTGRGEEHVSDPPPWATGSPSNEQAESDEATSPDPAAGARGIGANDQPVPSDAERRLFADPDELLVRPSPPPRRVIPGEGAAPTTPSAPPRRMVDLGGAPGQPVAPWSPGSAPLPSATAHPQPPSSPAPAGNSRSGSPAAQSPAPSGAPGRPGPGSPRSAAPPPTLPPGTPAAKASTSARELVGLITGPVTVDYKTYRFWAWKLLLPLLAANFLVGLALGGLQSGLPGLTPLLTLLIVVVFLVIIIGQAVGFRSKQVLGGLARASAGALNRTAQLGAAGLAAGARGIGQVASAGSISEQSLALRRFRVQTPFGSTQSCVMLGEITGDDLRSGDVVRVHGPVKRAGHRTTRRVEVLSGADGPVVTTVTAKRPFTFLAPWILDLVAKVLIVAVLLLDTFALLARS